MAFNLLKYFLFLSSSSRNERGVRAEILSQWMLRLKGYRILAHRYQAPQGEIDLIAKRGRTIAFIEVKSREKEQAFFDAILPRQQRRIEKAAEHYLCTYKKQNALQPRFDVIFWSPKKWPHHIVDAWRSFA